MQLQPAARTLIESHALSPTEGFPNNPTLPLLVYRRALQGLGLGAADGVERLFTSNGWLGIWRNGVFGYHHFHSNAHEVLGVCVGHAQVQFGGPSGPAVDVGVGDVAILPAGTGHKRIAASEDFLVVGAYPAGQEDYDLLRGNPAEQAAAEERIAAVPQPDADPVYGAGGLLLKRWKKN